MLYGKKFEIDKNLASDEYNYIDANLNLYKKLALSINKQVLLNKGIPTGFTGETEIWLVREGKDAWLTYPTGFNGYLNKPKVVKT